MRCFSVLRGDSTKLRHLRFARLLRLVRLRNVFLSLFCCLSAEAAATAQTATAGPPADLQDARRFWKSYIPGRASATGDEQRAVFCRLLEIYDDTPENELTAGDRLAHVCAGLRCSYADPIAHAPSFEFVRRELVKFGDVIRAYRSFREGRQLDASERARADGKLAQRDFRISNPELPVVYVLDVTDAAMRLSEHNDSFGRVCQRPLAVIWSEAVPLFPESLQRELQSRYQVFVDLDESSLRGPSLLHTAVRDLKDRLNQTDSTRERQGAGETRAALDRVYAQWVQGVQALQDKFRVLRVVDQFVEPLWASANSGAGADAMNDAAEYQLRSELARLACAALADAIREAIGTSSVASAEQRREVDRLRTKLLTMVLSWGWKLWELASQCPWTEQGRARYRDMAGFERAFLDESGRVLLPEHQEFLHAHLAQVCVMLGNDAEAVVHQTQAGARLPETVLSRLRGFRQSR